MIHHPIAISSFVRAIQQDRLADAQALRAPRRRWRVSSRSARPRLVAVTPPVVVERVCPEERRAS